MTIEQTNIENKIVEVSSAEKVQSLETSIYELTKNYAFFGTILQCLDIHYSDSVPTAGVTFDTNNKKWVMYINPVWFCHKLGNGDQGTKYRMSILLHEIYHLTHKHLIRAPMMRLRPDRRRLMNIAMDMSINQYIKDLPQGCSDCPPREARLTGAKCENKDCMGYAIMVEDYFDTDKDGKIIPWEHKKSFEYYYYKLIERYSEINDDESSGEDGDGESGEGGNGSGGKKKNKNGNGDGLPQEFDSHSWESTSDEKDMMDATEELVKRAMQKRDLSYDRLPGFIQDLLQDIEARRSELNYRQLILSAIKKHASGTARKHTWSRMSRRYGNIAPGTKIDELPKLANFIDTSGSISVQEANDFLSVIDSFLAVGHRKSTLGLWHTELYKNEPYKLGDRLDKSTIQSGGTDLTAVLKHIAEEQPDLSIILTDGCYSDVDFESMMPTNTPFPQVIWIISQDGREDHPISRLGTTIKIPKTSALKKDAEF